MLGCMVKSRLIFCDFDGVIRHWDNSTLFEYEEELGLQKGMTFRHAFRADLLAPAITGEVSDEVWRGRVEQSLSAEIGAQDAARLIELWNSSGYQIDQTIIEYFRQSLPKYKLALVTNATSRLDQDLSTIGLIGTFDFVINSADLGVAKPDHGYYQKAIKITDADVTHSIFIDDSQKNVTAAEQVGLVAFYFEGIEQLKKEIQTWQETKR